MSQLVFKLSYAVSKFFNKDYFFMLNLKHLAKALTTAESKKKQVNIAQMTEVLSHLSDLTFQNPEVVFYTLFQNGEARYKKQLEKEKKQTKA